MVIANHASYIDMFLVLSAFPARVSEEEGAACRCCCPRGAYPVVGKTFEYSGAFKVYFQAKGSGFGKAACEDDFGVDKTRQQEEVDKMDAHLRKGLVIGVFPEGKMNGTPERSRASGAAPLRRQSSTPCQSTQSHFQAPLTAGPGRPDRWLTVHDPGRLDKLATPDGTETAPDAAADSRRSAAGRCKDAQCDETRRQTLQGYLGRVPVTGGD